MACGGATPDAVAIGFRRRRKDPPSEETNKKECDEKKKEAKEKEAKDEEKEDDDDTLSLDDTSRVHPSAFDGRATATRRASF